MTVIWLISCYCLLFVRLVSLIFPHYINLYHFQGQRTVYRLTIVKSWNSEEIEGYAELVDLGKPDFIEIKVSLVTQ